MKQLVLVVENDAGTRKLLGLLMARFGFEADAVAGAADALILVDRIDYDVLFIDLVLGTGGGEEMLDALAAARPDALDRVIVLSSALETQIEQLSRRWPTVGIVRKPFDLEEIGEAARRVAKDRPRRSASVADDFCRRSVLSGANSGLVVRVDGRQVEPVLAFGYAPRALDAFFPMNVDHAYPICAAIRDSSPVWLASNQVASTEYPLLAPFLEENGSRAIAAVPMVKYQAVIGAAGWTFREPHRFVQKDRLALMRIADDAAAAIDAN